MTRTRFAVILTALVTVALAAPAWAGAARLTDQQIKARIEQKLADRDISGVTVTVQDGKVALSGTVPSAWAKDEAFSIATHVDDVMSVASDVGVARGESDTTIASEVARRLRQYVFYTVFDDASVRVKDGVVTLTGYVTMPYKSQEMAKMASHVMGVQEVKNEMQTLPASTFDDQLRYEIASQIYNDPMFWDYAIQVTPPIHIVVSNGHVILSGVVRSEIERRKAEIIARDTFGVLGVENDLRIES
jgi:osmotically-inducible protein OsmY